MEETTTELKRISQLFYDLILALRAQHFDFCAYVIEDAYQFYMVELEKKLEKNNVN